MAIRVFFNVQLKNFSIVFSSTGVVKKFFLLAKSVISLICFLLKDASPLESFNITSTWLNSLSILEKSVFSNVDLVKYFSTRSFLSVSNS